MKRSLRALLSVALIGSVVACAVAPQQAETELCSNAAVAAAAEVHALRDIATKCSGNSEVYARAVSKLNQLPPPSPKQIALQPPVETGGAERVRYEAEVYFYFLEAYPPDLAFEKLNELIGRINRTFRIESIRIVGSRDRTEKDLPSFDVARKRADFIRRYLLAAGLSSGVQIELSQREPRQADTPEGGARDRVAEITIVALRRSPADTTSYADKLRAAIKPNVRWTAVPNVDPVAEVEVMLDSEGKITSTRLVQGSGVSSWDEAVLRALQLTGRIPKDVDGRVPPRLLVRFRAKEW